MQYKHGAASNYKLTPEYRAWRSMKDRCTRKKNKSFSIYGGRGITIHERWLSSFEEFFKELGPKPSETHSLERIDNEKGYEPGNVRWATKSEQARNRRTNKSITINGETKLFVEWCETFNIPTRHVRSRMRNCGWNLEKALKTPIRSKCQQ